MYSNRIGFAIAITCIRITRKLSRNARRSFGLLGTIDSDRSVPCESIRIVLHVNRFLLLLHWLFPIGYILLSYKPILIAPLKINSDQLLILEVNLVFSNRF